jgi:glyoxylase-like metal-dependent hydrolase (beta-lactamase superfamily II)
MPGSELGDAANRENAGRTTLSLGYNCLLFNSGTGWAIVDPGLGANFLGYGASMEPLVGQLTRRLGEAGLSRAAISAVLFTHLHQDHARGAT